MLTRLSDLAFDSGPLAIEVFERLGGLPLARGLKQGFVIMHPNRTALSFASSLSERHAHRLLGAKHEGMSTGDPSDESRKSYVSW